MAMAWTSCIVGQIQLLDLPPRFVAFMCAGPCFFKTIMPQGDDLGVAVVEGR